MSGESKERQALLRAPRLKIERAKHHVNDLNWQINAFLARRPFKVIVRIDPKAAKRTLEVVRDEAVPDGFALIIGDAIHNLRAALDLLIFAMAGDKAERPEAVQFPFCARAEALESAITNRQIKVAGEKVVNVINALKPYPGGDQLLYGVHALDIADKHKLILTVGNVSDIPAEDVEKILADPRFTPNVKFAGPGILRSRGNPLITEDLQFASRADRRALRPSVYEPKVQPTFQICFGEGELFAFDLVIEKLRAMTIRIEEVVNALADAYFAV